VKTFLKYIECQKIKKLSIFKLKMSKKCPFKQKNKNNFTNLKNFKLKIKE